MLAGALEGGEVFMSVRLAESTTTGGDDAAVSAGNCTSMVFASRDGRLFYLFDEYRQRDAAATAVFDLEALVSHLSEADRRSVEDNVLRCLHAGTPWRERVHVRVDELVEDTLLFAAERVALNGRYVVVLKVDIAVPATGDEAGSVSRLKSDFSFIVDSIPAGLAIFDRRSAMVYYNSTFSTLFGHVSAHIRLGANFVEVFNRLLERSCDSSSRTEDDRQILFTTRTPEGRWIRIHRKFCRNGYAVVTAFDITELKRAENRLKEQAERDALTGLLNRGAFFEHFGKMLQCRRRADVRHGALVLFDLDFFKSVNDIHGHQAGDEYLVEIAERLRSGTRRTDLTARLGGDEFVAYLPGMAPENLPHVMDALHARLTAPLRLRGKHFQPGVSMGVVLIGDGEDDVDELMARADVALFRAKQKGRNRWSNFDPELERQNERRKRVLAGLREALADGAVGFALQPVVELPGRVPVGFEVLARWRMDGEDIPPEEFITIAEKNGLILDLGRLLMEKICRWFRETRQSGTHPGRLFVNVSPIQLKDRNFIRQAGRILRKYGMTPDALEVEITETALLERDMEIIGRHLKLLRRTGFRIALDDFGTGNASFAYLRQLPIHCLKIDRSFVRDIGRNRQNTAIARAILDIAHYLEMSSVAEGVETPSQAAFLEAHGCKLAQGNLFSPALPPEEALEWLREKQCS